MSSLTLILTAAVLAPEVSVVCDRPNGWSFDVCTREAEPGVCIARIRGLSPKETLPPTFRTVVSFPQLDAEYVWNPNFGCGENLVFLPKGGMKGRQWEE